MNEDDKALVERLRWGAWNFDDPFDGKAYASDDPQEAADRIEQLTAEVERLREALALWVQYDDFDQTEFVGLGPMFHYNKAISATRAALEGKQ